MEIRNYFDTDELEWLRCRVLSFLDSSYYNDVLQHKEKYDNDAVCLVAEEKDKIIGLIDVEIESEQGSLCVEGNKRGAVIWHLAVLPEYRRNNIAALLWKEAQKQLILKNVRYCEAWTQEDEAANKWYASQGFHNIKERNWLRCYACPSKSDWFLNKDNVGEIYGVENMVFEVYASRRKEVTEYCYKIDEVRLFAKNF